MVRFSKRANNELVSVETWPRGLEPFANARIVAPRPVPPVASKHGAWTFWCNGIVGTKRVFDRHLVLNLDCEYLVAIPHRHKVLRPMVAGYPRRLSRSTIASAFPTERRHLSSDAIQIPYGHRETDCLSIPHLYPIGPMRNSSAYDSSK